MGIWSGLCDFLGLSFFIAASISSFVMFSIFSIFGIVTLSASTSEKLYSASTFRTLFIVSRVACDPYQNYI